MSFLGLKYLRRWDLGMDELWNNLPVNLSVLSSYVSFKRKLKDSLVCELEVQY